MRKLLASKGADYTRDVDRLANFKNAGKRYEMSPMKALMVYVDKHMEAIATYTNTGKVNSEDILSRFIDVANYMVLGAALVVDAMNAEGGKK